MYYHSGILFNTFLEIFIDASWDDVPEDCIVVIDLFAYNDYL